MDKMCEHGVFVSDFRVCKVSSVGLEVRTARNCTMAKAADVGISCLRAKTLVGTAGFGFFLKNQVSKA